MTSVGFTQDEGSYAYSLQDCARQAHGQRSDMMTAKGLYTSVTTSGLGLCGSVGGDRASSDANQTGFNLSRGQ